MKLSRILLGSTLASLCLVSGGGGAQVITEFSSGITPAAQPRGITAGPDGNLWFTETATGKIGKITPTGAVTEYSTGISPAASLSFIAAGPDGNLWFTEFTGNRVGMITPDGVVTEYSTGISVGAHPLGITAGPDGNMWFAEGSGRIGKITTAGVVTEYSSGMSAGASPGYIAAGSDGSLWFTEYAGRIGKITTAGVITEYSIGISGGAHPYGIAAGPDGNLWFAEYGGKRIGRITPDGTVVEYSTGISASTGIQFITAGPDGNLWFTGLGPDRIGRITPAGVISEYASGITAGAVLGYIAAGPDGNVWFAEINGNQIGRITVGPANYEGLWWAAPASSESGWGINFAHQSDTIFASWFTYDTTGKGWWLVMTAPRTAPGVYSGHLLATHGPRFDAFDTTKFQYDDVGTGTLTFADANNGSFRYVIGAVDQTKSITRQVFGALPTCSYGTQPNLALATNYQDLWWAKPGGSEAGWGINLNHEGNTIFATWFTYDIDGTPMWLVVTTTNPSPGVYTGDLLRTHGPRYDAYDTTQFKYDKVGTAKFTFADGNTASFEYTVQVAGMAVPVTQMKTITRQLFSALGTTCQ